MKCNTKRCRNKRAKRRNFCYRCISRQNRERYGVQSTFYFLRGNAKRRGIDFDLTLEQFRVFCTNTEYLKLKGKKSGSMSIDRIDNRRGYEIDNIRLITLAENSRKRAVDYKIELGAYPDYVDAKEAVKPDLSNTPF